MVVPLHLRAAAAHPHRVDPLGRARDGDVEHRQLRPLQLALPGGVLAHAQQHVVRQRVEVGRVAEDLQLALHGGPRRVRQVHDVERVDLAEGDDVAAVAQEAHREDALALAQSGDPADLGEAVVSLRQDRHHALGGDVAERRRVGGGHPEVALVLVHRELVEEPPLHLSRRPVHGPVDAGDVEAMDPRDVPLVECLWSAFLKDPPVHPLLGGHVEALRRGVHRLTVGQDPDRPVRDGLQAPGEVQRQDRQHPEPGELRRMMSGGAVEEGALGDRPAPVVLQHVVGNPALDGGLLDDPPVLLQGRPLAPETPVLGGHERKPRRVGAHDHPGHAVDHPGRQVAAVDEETAGDRRPLGVRQVDLDERGDRAPELGRDDVPEVADRDAAAARLAEQQRPVAEEEQVARPEVLEVQGPHELRGRAGEVYEEEPALRQGQESLTVRLHDVRLVHPRGLDVRPGVVHTLHRGRGASGGLRGRLLHHLDPASQHRDARLPGQPPRGDVLQRVALHVGEEFLAVRERPQAPGQQGDPQVRPGSAHARGQQQQQRDR